MSITSEKGLAIMVILNFFPEFLIMTIILFKTQLTDDELITATRRWEKNSQICIVLVGGGHFAGAIFNG